MNPQAELTTTTALRFAKEQPGFVLVLYLLLISVGLYGSWQIVFRFFGEGGLIGVDPDIIHSITLWQGVGAFGWPWLKDWIFTQDNWLLSLVPIHFALFLLFGAKPGIVVFMGWLIFVLSALVSGFVAWQLNAKRAAFLVPLVLLFLGFNAHLYGFVAFSTSHNITNLFGLVSLLLLLAWARKQQNIALFWILLLLITGAVSDPWMVAAYNLPIALVGLLLWLSPWPFPPNKIDRIECLKLLVLSAVSMFAVRSHLFGLLDFLPGMLFQVGDWDTIRSNSVLLIMNLGGLLNISPVQKHNDLVAPVLSLGVISILFFVIAAISIRERLQASNTIYLFFSFCFFSVGGILLAFTLNRAEAVLHSARFLVNCLYLIIIALGVLIDLNWNGLSRNLRILCSSVIILFLAAGIASNYRVWPNPQFSLQTDDTRSLLDFLKSNNLSYGYGAYWGSRANVVSALSDSGIRIRPVQFNSATGEMVIGSRSQTSRQWYQPEDVPPGQQNYFVHVTSDGEECADVALCIDGLSKQFGEPSRALNYKDVKFNRDVTILVWDHPLIGFQHSLKTGLGKVIYFDGREVLPKWTGWSKQEPWGIWSDGEAAVVLLSLSGAPSGDLELRLDGLAFLADQHPSQEVEVFVNEHHLANLKYDLQSNGGVRTVKIPRLLAAQNSGQLIIKFSFRNPKSPAELGLSNDDRRLGLGIISLELRAAKKPGDFRKSMYRNFHEGTS